MKKFYLPAFLLFTISGLARAQQMQNPTCGNVPYTQIMLENHPEIQQNRDQIEIFTQQFITDHLEEKDGNAVVTIPVVVHVVYGNATENISDTRINEQISILNKDYSRTNTDANQTPSAFTGVAANCEIQFCLAQTDPQGNPTTGITRTSTNVSTFSINSDNVKFTSQGGKDGWPSSQYLNIWVCDLGGGLLGYATPPGFPAAYDGVVIGYKYFGQTGATAPYNRGRTGTHEVGHWLNLEHIWGDANCGNDNVSDTPTQQEENYGCPSFPHVTCGNGPNGDMFMNYMDYTNDACMNIFTTGQKNRMMACLNGPRSSILSSNKCTVNGGGGGGGSCDTLSNWTSGDQAALYSYQSPASGYLGGHNSYQDKAKAEKFTNIGSNKVVTKVIYGFGAVDNENGSSTITCAIWGNSGGAPGSELSSVNVSATTIDGHVAGGLYSIVTFPNPVVNATFFAGIKMTYSGNYAYSLFTSTDGDQNPATAWEQLSDNSWVQFGTPNATSTQVSLAVFPVVCDQTLGEETILIEDIKIFPNPSSGLVNIFVPSATDETSIRVFNMMGQLIEVQPMNGEYDQTSVIDLSGQVDGIYIVEVTSGNHTQVQKVILRK